MRTGARKFGITCSVYIFSCLPVTHLSAMVEKHGRREEVFIPTDRGYLWMILLRSIAHGVDGIVNKET